MSVARCSSGMRTENERPRAISGSEKWSRMSTGTGVATGARDPLYARVLVLKAGPTRLALVDLEDRPVRLAPDQDVSLHVLVVVAAPVTLVLRVGYLELLAPGVEAVHLP